MTIIIIYAVIFALNLLIFFNYVSRKEYQSELFFYICLALVLRSYGQLMVAGAKSLEMALFSYKVFYFGSAFLPAFLFLAVARLGKVELPRFTEIAAVAYSSVIMLLASTVGNWDIYYSKVYLAIHNAGYSTLEREYGPTHILYSMMLIIYGVGFLYVFIKARNKINTMSKKMITVSFYLAMALIVLCIADRYVSLPISLTSIGYLMATILCMRIVVDAEIHDLTGCIQEAMNEKDEEGIAVFDKREGFINANEKAKLIFPEIKSLSIGKPVPEDAGRFYNKIASHVKELRYGLYRPEDQEILDINGSKYEISLSDIFLRNGDASVGTFVEMEDVTLREKIAEVEEQYSNELEEDVKKKETEIRDMQNRLVLGLATLVESRDSSTGEHIVRTVKGVEVFTDALKRSGRPDLTEEYLDAIRMATPMHDLGKIAIDDEILCAKNKTPEQEKTIIRLHTEEGTKIVRKVLSGINGTEKGSRFTEIAAIIANYHHERWDGSGLPYGLRGKEIPMEARIVAYLDALDTLIEDGDENGKKTFNEAFDEIVNGIGTYFDPDLGVEFVKCRKELEKIYDAGNEI